MVSLLVFTLTFRIETGISLLKFLFLIYEQISLSVNLTTSFSAQFIITIYNYNILQYVLLRENEKCNRTDPIINEENIYEKKTWLPTSMFF